MILAEALSVSLGGLLAMAEMMRRQPLTPAARDQLSAVLRSGRRMARTLEDVLRPEPEAPLERIVLRELLEELESGWRSREAGGSGRTLMSMNFSPDLHVAADRPRLARLLDLLADGARRRAAGGFTEIDVFAAATEGDARLEIRTSGLRPSSPDDEVRLTHLRRLARELDGEIGARTGACGEELTLTLRLPVAGVHEAGAEEAADEAPLPDRTHLLIVDDNATNRMVAAALCSMFGCTSETAEDGLEAVDAVRERPFDLILMDIKMPRMDGIAATKAIRSLKGSAAATPIVALTANADPEAVASCLAVGMAAVVDKPIKPAQLLLAMQSALGMPLQEARHAPAA